MSSIKFNLRSKANKPVSIYVSISINRDLKFREKTGFDIHPNNWSDKKSMPKQNVAELKTLHNDLVTLEAHIYNQLNIAQAEGRRIDKAFIRGTIDSCFNRVDNSDQNLFIYQVQTFIDNAHKKKVKNRSSIGLSSNTIKNWKAFKSKFERFEKWRKATVTLDQLDLALAQEFQNWSFDVEAYSKNTVGKDLAFIKQITDEAERKGIKTNTQSRLIESFSESDEDRYIITLSYEELNQIEKHHPSSDFLDQVKQWLLIGCELGQRGDDLLKVDFNSIREVKGHQLIDVYQKKAKKWVTLPITPRCKLFLSNGFPEHLRYDQFNDGLKDLLQEVGISEVIEGKKRIVLEEGKTRTVLGRYPKHELVTTHTCRRSFATNYYKKLPTPVIMDITGHVKESTFLKYIGKPKDRDDNALLFLSYLNMQK